MNRIGMGYSMAHDLFLNSSPRSFSREDSTVDVCGSDLSDSVKSGTSSLLMVYKTVPKPVKIAMITGGVLIAYGTLKCLSNNINARV
jgi:hypothetical protein